MSYIDNRSPFAAELFSVLDVGGQEVQVLVVAAAFEKTEKGSLEPAVIQPPVRVADEYVGDPALSSLRYEADIALSKPFVDVIVNGTSYAPKGTPARSIMVELHIGDVNKKLLVHGDRKGWKPSRSFFPDSFVTMPIIYERAYGGTDSSSSNPKKYEVYRYNPVGLGFKGIRAHDPNINTHLPNIEYADLHLGISRRSPAGFGMVGRSWMPRITLAGTYDEKWLKTQWPLLPLDFNPLHYQCAPLDQQSRTICGGETVHLVNLTPDGIWTFKLPKLNVPVRLFFDDRATEIALRMDTVLIEPDLGRVTLSHRVGIPIGRNRAPLRELVLGHVESAWVRAKVKRKRYWDPRGTAGTNAYEPSYL